MWPAKNVGSLSRWAESNHNLFIVICPTGSMKLNTVDDVVASYREYNGVEQCGIHAEWLDRLDSC